MGKKSKKLNKTQDNEVPSTNVVELEPEEENFKMFTAETNTSTDSVKKSKKKNRKRELNGTIIEDAPVQINSEEIIESNTSENATTMIKKEKKKKQNKLNEEELCEEVHNDTDTNKFNEDQPSVPKKKKKKSKLLEDTSIIETSVIKEEHKPQKDHKEKKNKNSLSNEPNLDKEKAPKQSEGTTQKMKKGKNKAKTGAPVLNSEESQVTEEDIDRFIDEIDEEDNKQYEDWVKLLDARLSKKQTE